MGKFSYGHIYVYAVMCVHTLSRLNFCNPMDVEPMEGLSVHKIFHKNFEQGSFSCLQGAADTYWDGNESSLYSKDVPNPGIIAAFLRLQMVCGFFSTGATWEAHFRWLAGMQWMQRFLQYKKINESKELFHLKKNKQHIIRFYQCALYLYFWFRLSTFLFLVLCSYDKYVVSWKMNELFYF